MVVATVLTVYGIETSTYDMSYLGKYVELQQYLPFTVLKPWYLKKYKYHN